MVGTWSGHGRDLVETWSGLPSQVSRFTSYLFERETSLHESLDSQVVSLGRESSLYKSLDSHVVS
jgi:hypothetical protein